MKERTLAVSLVNYNETEGLLGLLGYFVSIFSSEVLNITMRKVVIGEIINSLSALSTENEVRRRNFTLFINTYELLRII